MAASALFPFMLSHSDFDPLEFAAAVLAVKEIQHSGSQQSRADNADLLGYGWLQSGFGVEGHRPFQSTPVGMVRRALDLVECATGQPSINEPDVVPFVRFAWKEAAARWATPEGISTRLVAGPSERKLVTRRKERYHLDDCVHNAVNYIAQKYPPLFSRAYWRLTSDGISWSKDEQPGSIETAHGLSLTNVDLPEDFHVAAQASDPEARYAYRVIELSWDLRGYGLSVQPSEVGDIPDFTLDGLVPPWIDEWLRRVAACELAAVASDWYDMRVREQRKARVSRVRDLAAAEFARHNAARAAAADQWRVFAARRGTELRAESKRRPLRDIAAQIADEANAAQVFGQLNAETIDRFLRDQHPHLRRA